MATEVARHETPEERELERKRAELAGLAAELADRELELATLRASLRAFEMQYLRIVGVKYAELDEIEAQIAEAEATQYPTDAEAGRRAEQARARARESGSAASIAQDSEERPRFTASERLKKLYREIARRLHPDLAGDESDRGRRTRLMAEANSAYEAGDEARLEAILREWETSPESVRGEGAGAELVRIIRRIAQAEARIQAIGAEIAQLRASELHETPAGNPAARGGGESGGGPPGPAPKAPPLAAG